MEQDNPSQLWGSYLSWLGAVGRQWVLCLPIAVFESHPGPQFPPLSDGECDHTHLPELLGGRDTEAGAGGSIEL